MIIRILLFTRIDEKKKRTVATLRRYFLFLLPQLHFVSGRGGTVHSVEWSVASYARFEPYHSRISILVDCRNLIETKQVKTERIARN